jgi:hypothetical protein
MTRGDPRLRRKRRQGGEVDLEASLQDLRAFRRRDPDFERAIADYIDAEASLKEDPAEGQRADS